MMRRFLVLTIEALCYQTAIGRVVNFGDLLDISVPHTHMRKDAGECRACSASLGWLEGNHLQTIDCLAAGASTRFGANSGWRKSARGRIEASVTCRELSASSEGNNILEHQNTRGNQRQDTSEREHTVDEKVGVCLICRSEFPSAWAGERVCRRCKTTSIWRNGALK